MPGRLRNRAERPATQSPLRFQPRSADQSALMTNQAGSSRNTTSRNGPMRAYPPIPSKSDVYGLIPPAIVTEAGDSRGHDRFFCGRRADAGLLFAGRMMRMSTRHLSPWSGCDTVESHRRRHDPVLTSWPDILDRDWRAYGNRAGLDCSQI
jgi:hypothetical protein